MKEVHSVRVLSITPVARNVHSIRLEKPAGYKFIPGQATEVSVKKPEWEAQKRPFTFTSLNEEPTLEFTIKSYADHHGVTEQIGQLKEGDTLIVRDVWGTIAYKGEGYFIAGGAGVTPFIAILRQLHKEGKIGGNKLFFSNKTAQDVILEAELRTILGDNAVFVLSEEEGNDDYVCGHIDEVFLKERVDDFQRHFYVCGPDRMIKAINEILVKSGASPDTVVFEQ